MNSTARLWFALFAVVGVLSGLAAGMLLWIMVTRPMLAAQAAAGWW